MKRVYVATEVLWKRPYSTIAYVRAFPRWLGILAGAIGAFAPVLGSMVTRMSLGTSPPGDLTATLSVFPLTTVFFLTFALVQGVFGRLLGGECQLLSFVSELGWAWLPAVAASTFLACLAWPVSRFPAEPLSTVTAVALVLVIAVFITALWMMRLQFGVLRETMGLNRGRALFVYLLTAIPAFFIFDLIA